MCSSDLGSARAHLRFGSMTGRPNQAAMSHTFTGLNVPAGTTVRALHVGIGDGESAFYDPAMLFNAGAVSAANLWSGREGNYWDDDRLTLSSTRLPAGTSPRVNTQGATGECLSWGYAALTYRGP